MAHRGRSGAWLLKLTRRETDTKEKLKLKRLRRQKLQYCVSLHLSTKLHCMLHPCSLWMQTASFRYSQTVTMDTGG